MRNPTMLVATLALCAAWPDGARAAEPGPAVEIRE